MTTVETPEARAAISIPEDWRDLPWPALKSLAAKMTDEPVHDKADALAAVTAELTRRGVPGMAEGLPPLPDAEPAAGRITKAGPVTPIPPNWHEDMSVAEIIALASSIDPDGNPVDVVRAEIARRGAA